MSVKESVLTTTSPAEVIGTGKAFDRRCRRLLLISILRKNQHIGKHVCREFTGIERLWIKYFFPFLGGVETLRYPRGWRLASAPAAKHGGLWAGGRTKYIF